MIIIGGYQDIRSNKEDFVITPFLFLVWLNGQYIKIYGIGICWFYYSLYIGISFNLPKKYPSFTILNRRMTKYKQI